MMVGFSLDFGNGFPFYSSCQDLRSMKLRERKRESCENVIEVMGGSFTKKKNQNEVLVEQGHDIQLDFEN